MDPAIQDRQGQLVNARELTEEIARAVNRAAGSPVARMKQSVPDLKSIELAVNDAVLRGLWTILTHSDTATNAKRRNTASRRSDVRYNHFGATLLLLRAYRPAGRTTLCLRW